VNPPPVTAVAVALSAVLSSGVTAAYLRATMPDVLAVRTGLDVTPEQRHLAALLVAPGEPYAVAAGGPVDAKQLGPDGLAALGFRRGWTQTWRAPEQQRVDAFLLEFDAERGARAYAQRIGQAARLMTDPKPFTVTGVPGSSGLASAVKDKDGNYAQVVALHRGSRAVLLVFATKQAVPGSEVVGLAQRQWAALAAT
jgi:hypothetical protein